MVVGARGKGSQASVHPQHWEQDIQQVGELDGRAQDR